MSKNRIDAWNEEQDLLLAETVLRFVREGRTQQQAFSDVSDRLNRTDTAVAFRWNSTVKQNYQKALELAKKKKRSFSKQSDNRINQANPKPAVNFQDALRIVIEHLNSGSFSNEDIRSLQMENEKLKNRIAQLEEENSTYLGIFERARNMVSVS